MNNKETISYHIIDGLLEISTKDDNKKIILGSDSFRSNSIFFQCQLGKQGML